jgi:hypothetical protein
VILAATVATAKPVDPSADPPLAACETRDGSGKVAETVLIQPVAAVFVPPG